MKPDEQQRCKADYGRDGYVVVPGCLDAQTLARLRDALDSIAARYAQLPPNLRAHIMFETDFVKIRPSMNEIPPEQLGNAIRLIMELPLFDPVFAELILYAPLLDVLQTLFGTSEFAFHNYKVIIKAPRVSSAFVWHRDLPYLQHTSPNLITAMLCMDEMTEANGATVVFPGTHRIAHEQVTAADVAIPEEKLPDAPRVTVCCPAGSAVLFHVNIIHGGGPNRSDTPRRNVIGIWTAPQTYPTGPYRYAYQDLMPRTRDPLRRRQLMMSFPDLAKEKA